MAWSSPVDSTAPMMRWQAVLTLAEPDAGTQCLALIASPTLQIEGELGGGLVEITGSNSGAGGLPLYTVDREEIVPLLPVYEIRVRVVDPTSATRITLTLAGRR